MPCKSVHGIMHDASKVAQIISIISSGNQVPIPFRKYLLKYYAVTVNGREYGEMISDGNLVHQGVIYQIVYPAGQTKYPACATEVEISFRQVKHYLGCPNYAVVSIKR